MVKIHLQSSRCRRLRFNPWVGKIPLRRKWQPTPVFLPEKSHGQRSLVGYGVAKSRTQLSTYTHVMTAKKENESHLARESLLVPLFITVKSTTRKGLLSKGGGEQLSSESLP